MTDLLKNMRNTYWQVIVAHQRFSDLYIPLILCPLVLLSWMHEWWCFNEVFRVCIRIHQSWFGWLAPVQNMIICSWLIMRFSDNVIYLFTGIRWLRINWGEWWFICDWTPIDRYRIFMIDEKTGLLSIDCTKLNLIRSVDWGEAFSSGLL